jgi:hypothetical protein
MAQTRSGVQDSFASNVTLILGRVLGTSAVSTAPTPIERGYMAP